MKKGAIFDLDGTLVSSPGLHVNAWQELFCRYGISLTEDELKEQAGYKNLIFISKVLERRGIMDLDPAVMSGEKDEMVVNILDKKPAEIIAGVKELLQMLKNNGTKIGLATNATRRTGLVLGKEIIQFFDFKVFAEDVGHGKPDPEIFLKTAMGLGLKSEECIVFEDAENGVEAAKNGNFFCIARDNQLGQNLIKADLIVKEYKPEELFKYFTTC